MEWFYKENQVILSMTEYNELTDLKENFSKELQVEKNRLNNLIENTEKELDNLKDCKWYIEVYHNHYTGNIELINTEILKDNKYVKKIAKELSDEKINKYKESKKDEEKVFQQEKEMFEQEKKSYRLHQWLKSFCFWLWFWLAIYLISLI